MRINSKRILPGLIIFFLMALIGIAQVVLLATDVKAAALAQLAQAELAQKSALAIKVFRNNPEQATAVLVEQLQILTPDPWGINYRFLAFPNQYQWASAGPDRQWDTADDLIITAANDDDAARNQPPLLPPANQAPAN